MYGGTTGAARAGARERVARAAGKGPDQTPFGFYLSLLRVRQKNRQLDEQIAWLVRLYIVIVVVVILVG